MNEIMDLIFIFLVPFGILMWLLIGVIVLDMWRNYKDSK